MEDFSALFDSLVVKGAGDDVFCDDVDNELMSAGEDNNVRSLVGRIISTKFVSCDAIIGMAGFYWKLQGAYEIEAFGQNIFLFRFALLTDRKRILEGGLWIFYSNLLVLKELDAFANPASTNFDFAELWVQIHKVPMICMSRRWGFELGKSVGQVVDVDINALGDCLGRYLRVHILVDISKSLTRVVQRRLKQNQDPFIFPLRYERLPDLCYLCGVLGHPFKECLLKPPHVRKDSVLKFGDCIRVYFSVKNNLGAKRGRPCDSVMGTIPGAD